MLFQLQVQETAGQVHRLILFGALQQLPVKMSAELFFMQAAAVEEQVESHQVHWLMQVQAETAAAGQAGQQKPLVRALQAQRTQAVAAAAEKLLHSQHTQMARQAVPE
jgi:hypothetical protein